MTRALRLLCCLALLAGVAWAATRTLRLSGWSERGFVAAELEVVDDAEVPGKVALLLSERAEGEPIRTRRGTGYRAGTWIRCEFPRLEGLTARLGEQAPAADPEPLLVFVKDDPARGAWMETWRDGRRVGAARSVSTSAPLDQRDPSQAAVDFAGEAAFAEVDLSGREEPALAGSQASRYERPVRGVLYLRGEGDAHEVAPNDVHQGALGTCYLLATLAAIARTDPGVLQERIHDEGDGSYTVTFLGAGLQGRDVAVRVSDAVPSAGSGPAFVQYGDTRRAADGVEEVELWPIVLEKAWAKLRGGFARAGDDWETIAFAALSGRTFTHKSPHQLDPAAVLALLREAEAQGHPVALCADDLGTYPQLEPLLSRTGVIPYHAYTFAGLEGDRVLLRNPWGHQHPQPLSADEVVAIFATVTVGGF
ncbi:MAG: C2 family cysteine protease [Planctomycetota bacterium]